LYQSAGFPEVQVSAATGEGLDRLTELIAGKLSAFTGNSGVGKSSLLNAIEPGFTLKVAEVSEKLGRGRHTTRHVELYRLTCGAEVIDTPGFSSFDAEDLDLALKEHLPETFREFQPYLGRCRFINCSHTKEKGCAVLAAVKAGEIPQSRHKNYIRLYNELKNVKSWEK
ncbi:MAG: ribosome small subunit-dependent GTPase A, partial [Oscillospiraceae bacterium]|nr:ribosome small subunit-dependent GTPase A [Oscillospiraceae bacterium]